MSLRDSRTPNLVDSLSDLRPIYIYGNETGVNGLWKILSPVGRRIDIATLRGRRFAVDVSIWLTQFLKAMRDEEHRVANAPLLGCLRRILKLLYHRIKVVFVFDGGVPFLKHRVMERRRQRLAMEQDKYKRAAEKLLLNQMALAQIKGMGSGEGETSGGASGFVFPPDVQRAMEEARKEEEASSTNEKSPNGKPLVVSDDEEDDDESDDEDHDYVLPNTLGEIDLDTLKRLPQRHQKQIINRLKEAHTASNRDELIPVSNDPQKYSGAQLTQFLVNARRKLELQSIEKKLGDALTPNRAMELGGAESARAVNNVRLASDSKKGYLLTGEEEVRASRGELPSSHIRKPVTTTTTTTTTTKTLMRLDEEEEEDELKFEEDEPDEGLQWAIDESMREDVAAKKKRRVIEDDGDDDDDDREDERDVVHVSPVREDAPRVIAKTVAASTPPRSDRIEEEEFRKVMEASMRETNIALSPPVVDRPISLNSASDVVDLSTEKDGDKVPRETGKAGGDEEVEWEDEEGEEDDKMGEVEKAPQVMAKRDERILELFREALAPSIPDAQPKKDPITPLRLGSALPALSSTHATINNPSLGVSRHFASPSSASSRDSPRSTKTKSLSSSPPSRPPNQPSILDFHVKKLSASTPSRASDTPSYSSPSGRSTTSSKYFTSPGENSNATYRDEVQYIKEDGDDHERNDREANPSAEQIVEERDVLSPEQRRQREASAREAMVQTLEEQRSSLKRELSRTSRDADVVSAETKDDVKLLLRLFGIPFVEAPMEAEAQCVELEKEGLVDGVMTDDGDAFLFGARRVYRNVFSEKKFVEEFHADAVERGLGLDREAIVCLGLLLGGDYSEGIHGVGIVNALEIVSVFEGIKGMEDFREWVRRGKVPRSLGGNGKKTTNAKKEDDDEDEDDPSKVETEAEKKKRIAAEKFLKSHANARTRWGESVDDNFPPSQVVKLYMEPNVHRNFTIAGSHSDEGFSSSSTTSSSSSSSVLEWNAPDMEGLIAFCESRFGWTREKSEAHLKDPIVKYTSTSAIQTSIESYFPLVSYESKDNKFAAIKSKRLTNAVKSMRGTTTTTETKTQGEKEPVFTVSEDGTFVEVDEVKVESREDDTGASKKKKGRSPTEKKSKSKMRDAKTGGEGEEVEPRGDTKQTILTNVATGKKRERKIAKKAS